MKADLHEEAFGESAIIRRLPEGTAVQKGKEQGSRSYVLDETGQTGFIISDYLTDKKPGSQTQADNQ